MADWRFFWWLVIRWWLSNGPWCLVNSRMVDADDTKPGGWGETVASPMVPMWCPWSPMANVWNFGGWIQVPRSTAGLNFIGQNIDVKPHDWPGICNWATCWTQMKREYPSYSVTTWKVRTQRQFDSWPFLTTCGFCLGVLWSWMTGDGLRGVSVKTGEFSWWTSDRNLDVCKLGSTCCCLFRTLVGYVAARDTQGTWFGASAGPNYLTL